MKLIPRAMIFSTVAAGLCVMPSWSAPQDPPAAQGQTETKEDRELADKVRQALNEQQFAPDAKIQVKASNGVVTLMGEVPSTQISTKAEEAATRVAGNGKVVNQLQVKS